MISLEVTIRALKVAAPRFSSILAILTLAFLVRIVGVNFGLPNLYHADEPIVVNHALAFGGGDFNPHFFKIPPFTSYLLFALYGIYFLIGSAFGFFSSADDFLNLFLQDPTFFYLLGRIVFGVMVGVATVYVLYRLGRKFFSDRHGLIAAFFLAVSFLHARDSHYIYADIPLLFLTALSFFPIFEIRERGDQKDYLLFGILFGAAVATKYNAVFLLCPFLVAHLSRRRSPKFLFMSLITSIFFFFILNPFSLIDLRFFLQELFTQAGSEGFSGFFHHFRYSLSGGMGVPLIYLALAGVLLNSFSRELKRWILLSFVFIYSMVLAGFSQPYERYALPLLPFLNLFAADALIQIGGKIRAFQKWPMVFAALFAIPSIAKTLVSDYLFVQKDVRTEGREWIERYVPSDSKIALDIPFYGPRLKPNLKQILEKKEEGLEKSPLSRVQIKRLELLAREAEAKPEGRYELFFLADQPEGERFLFSKPAVPYSLSSLKRLGIDYVVVAQTDPLAHGDFYDAVRKNSQFVAEFNPYRQSGIERPIDRLASTGGPFLWKDLTARRANGQPIKIYRLK